MQGVRLIWGPLNTDFTVICYVSITLFVTDIQMYVHVYNLFKVKLFGNYSSWFMVRTPSYRESMIIIIQCVFYNLQLQRSFSFSFASIHCEY